MRPRGQRLPHQPVDRRHVQGGIAVPRAGPRHLRHHARPRLAAALPTRSTPHVRQPRADHRPPPGAGAAGRPVSAPRCALSNPASTATRPRLTPSTRSRTGTGPRARRASAGSRCTGTCSRFRAANSACTSRRSPPRPAWHRDRPRRSPPSAPSRPSSHRRCPAQPVYALRTTGPCRRPRAADTGAAKRLVPAGVRVTMVLARPASTARTSPTRSRDRRRT